MSGPERSEAERLDDRDPLGGHRERFLLPARGPIYLNGNSLGPLPAAVPARLEEVLRHEWGEGLVGSWEDWIDLPRRVASHLAELVGAAPSDLSISDSTSVNIYKLASAALDARQERSAIVVLEGEFPTDRYLMEGIADRRGAELRVAPLGAGEAPGPDHIAPVLDSDVAVVVLSLVSYRSSAIADLGGITDAAHRAGALVLWDLSHAVGSIPVNLATAEADLAVGCTYKYLNGGPGAPAFLYVRRDLQSSLTQPVWGWFGHARQFAFDDVYSPADGVNRFLVGTPPIISVAAAEPGISMVAAAGIEAIRAKGMAATELMVRFHDAHLAELGVGLGSPRDPSRRGSHLALTHREGLAISRWLRDEGGVVTDFRAPDTIRMAVSPLVTRYTEVWDAMEALREAISSEAYRDGGERRGRVT